ncbi:MAG: transcriptional regulator [Sphingobacteriales bacterium]|nr:MAG: transcriptional regulator [Sphingobacteriales bacterium]
MTKQEERKIQIDLDCGLNIFNLVAGGKWKACILKYISNGTKRPHELHKAMPYAAPRVLNMQLKELLEYKLVVKEVYPELPLRVEYELTEMAVSLLPLIDAMEDWGMQHRKSILAAFMNEDTPKEPSCSLSTIVPPASQAS